LTFRHCFNNKQQLRRSAALKQFTYTITDPMGLHARPAGKLVKAVKAMDSTVSVVKDGSGKPASAKKLMSVMGLGVKTSQSVTVTVEGGNEEANFAAIEQFFKENL